MVAQKLKSSQVQSAIANLASLPEKPRDEVSLREGIETMRDTIKQVMARGYSFDDVAKFLEKDGISISGTTLKQYMASPASKKASARKGRGTVRQKKLEVSSLTGSESSSQSQESKLLNKTDAEVSIKQNPEDEFSNY